MSATASVLRACLLVAVLAPAAMSLLVACLTLVRGARPGERATARLMGAGLFTSLLATCVVGATPLLQHAGWPGEVDFGAWLRVGTYEVPAVFLVDGVAVAFSLLASTLTVLVARFSRTYLHKEAGFARFFILLGLFGSGTQLVTFAGALDVMFAGWELIGISSALFIGFFHERDEPVRSSVRAFATYRLCDAGFLLGVVATHELLGSTRLAALAGAHALSTSAASTVAALFLLAAMGKSAQLPFSGWLARAMEGPTPSSALFYGGISVHLGVFLLLRIWPLLEAALMTRAVGAAVGIATAVYATLVARTHPDAKGALAHATLAQVGLILAELCAGFTQFALVHLVGHALLRVWQYLRAPNVIHDAHRVGHHHHPASLLERHAPMVARRLHAAAVHRFRVDEQIDRVIRPLLRVLMSLERVDERFRAALSLDKDRP